MAYIVTPILIMKYSEYAKKWIGSNEGGKQHKYIIDWYNSHIKPLPRNYKVSYKDSWCAAFVSFVLGHCDPVNPPYECSVTRMYDKAVKHGQIVKNPKVDDIVIYDWGANGTKDHVGIICKIKGDILYVTEGNKNDTVGIREISKHSRYIYAYIRVKQKVKDGTDTVVDDVIKGKYGTGEERKKKLEKEGYDYKAVQKAVNERLKK